MKKMIVLLLIPYAVFAANVEEDFSYGSALQENPESADYAAVVGTLQWRMQQVEKEIRAKCNEDQQCELITFREHIKGWTTNLTVGNGSGSGYAYEGGSGGAINIYNGDRINNNVVANIGIAYRNITCDRTPLVGETHLRAHVTLMSDLITEENKIKEELSPAEVVLLKVFSSIIKAAGQSGGCNTGNGGYR
ncbi:MAG: hypothetical protein KDD37_02715 [Bdellovibrionales bacterium]|nr:hypothetical protein [Bdellovibrionales bacterium]